MRKTLFLFACIALLVACSKSADSSSKAALLTAKPWKIVGDSILPGRFLGNQMVTNMYSLYKPCERDNYFIFSNDGTLEANNGPQKCDPTDFQSLKLTWFFSDGETKLSVSPDDQVFITGLGTPSDIVELTESTMVLRYYSRNPDGSIYRVHTLTLRN